MNFLNEMSSGAGLGSGRSAGPGVSIPGRPSSSPAHLCPWGALPLILGRPHELALRPPAPAALLLTDPEPGTCRLPAAGWTWCLGLAPVPQVRAQKQCLQSICYKTHELGLTIRIECKSMKKGKRGQRVQQWKSTFLKCWLWCCRNSFNITEFTPVKTASIILWNVFSAFFF